MSPVSPSKPPLQSEKPDAPSRMRRKSDIAPAVVDPIARFRDVVHAYGVREMAGALVMSVGTLYNKCSASEDSHHQPTLRDVVGVTRVSGDMAILDDLDALFDRAAFDLRDMGHLSDSALLELLTRLGREHGEFHAALHAALVAGRFRQADYDRVRCEALDVVSALMTLLARLEGLVDA